MRINPSTLVPGTRYWIAYLSKDGATYSERFIHCEEVVRRGGVWYVVAFCEMRNQRRLFLLTGIKDVRSCAPPRQATFSQAAVAAWWQTYLASDAVHDRLAFA